VGRIRSWLDVTAPSSTWAGIVGSVLVVAAGTLAVYPLKTQVDVRSLDAVYIPGVLFVAAKWGARIGLFCALLSGVVFDLAHNPPTLGFGIPGADAIVFVLVALAAVFVAGLSERMRAAEERRRLEGIARARMVVAADEERRRVVRDLHDGAQQRLVHAVITLKLAQQALADADGEAGDLVGEALDQTERANVELRELAHGILPSALTRGGLRAGIEELVERAPLPITVDVTAERFPAGIEATAYFVVSEALTNVVKYAHADRVDLAVRVEHGVLQIDVRDDGIGGAHSEGTSGLSGLEDRVSTFGGSLVIESPPSRGTRVLACVPLPAGD
jgi:signal transduction histidine kinase